MIYGEHVGLRPVTRADLELPGPGSPLWPPGEWRVETPHLQTGPGRTPARRVGTDRVCDNRGRPGSGRAAVPGRDPAMGGKAPVGRVDNHGGGPGRVAA